ncbi:hypothetical protein V1478_016756 [Vespula squamosa]|uniref:Uncharacterized protein n=1 Tax=Vespula squamosa TaxID=30214 RepID=A0ABD2A0Q9_VESSQ
MYAHAFFKSLNKCAHCDDDSIAIENKKLVEHFRQIDVHNIVLKNIALASHIYKFVLLPRYSNKVTFNSQSYFNSPYSVQNCNTLIITLLLPLCTNYICSKITMEWIVQSVSFLYIYPEEPSRILITLLKSLVAYIKINF